MLIVSIFLKFLLLYEDKTQSHEGHTTRNMI